MKPKGRQPSTDMQKGRVDLQNSTLDHLIILDPPPTSPGRPNL